MSSVASMAEARANRTPPGPKVYSCGKCGEQGTMLTPDHAMVCGREDPEKCTARHAADWYEPTNAKSRGKNPRPRIQLRQGIGWFCCGVCLFPYFHMQADGSITCYREKCKRTALFRWRWHEDTSRARSTA